MAEKKKNIFKKKIIQVPMRIAASVFLIFGLAVFGSRLGLTGAVIGIKSSGNFIYGLIGFLLLFVSTVLFFLSSKKKLNI